MKKLNPSILMIAVTFALFIQPLSLLARANSNSQSPPAAPQDQLDPQPTGTGYELYFDGKRVGRHVC